MEPTERSWQKKRKRWIAALVVLLLVVAYPASIGPAAYLSVWGVISYERYNAIYSPLVWFFHGPLGAALHTEEYVLWWVRLGERHSGNKL